MKKLGAIISIITVITLLLSVAVHAEDVLISGKVQRVVQKITKSGDTMVTVFIEEQRTLNGVEYTARAPIFASGPVKSEAEQIKEGDVIKAIVSKRSNNGDVTYSLLKVIK